MTDLSLSSLVRSLLSLFENKRNISLLDSKIINHHHQPFQHLVLQVLTNRLQVLLSFLVLGFRGVDDGIVILTSFHNTLRIIFTVVNLS